VIFEIPAHFAAPSSSGERPSFYQCKAAVTSGAFFIPVASSLRTPPSRPRALLRSHEWLS
jgi:hypothetical protein